MKKVLLIIIVSLLVLLQGCNKNSDGIDITVGESKTSTYDYSNFFNNNFENPYNLALFITDDPYTKMGINFEMPTNGKAYVDYRVAGDQTFTKIEANKKVISYKDNTYVFLYELTLIDLVPGTTYEYFVLNDGSEISDIYTFTMPQKNQDEFSFMFLADPQDNSEVGYMAYANAVLSVMNFANPIYNFVVFPGNLTDDREEQTQWNLFFRYSTIFSFNKPIVATIGDYDISPLTNKSINNLEFDGYMNLPNNGPNYDEFTTIYGDLRNSNFDNGKTYSFDYGDCHFVVIDTETYCNGTTACGDYDRKNALILNEWVKNDLQKNDKEWTIVIMNRSPYSASYNSSFVRNNLYKIFDANKVDLVLSGHDHQYSRAVYKDNVMVNFDIGDTYNYGDLTLSPNANLNRNFNYYSSDLGVTYLVSNTVSTKFYGGDKFSGVELNYIFDGEMPVIPIITVSEDGIHVVSYMVEKETNLSIVSTGVTILEDFIITH